MAQEDSAIIIGIDVCKAKLDIFEQESGRAYSMVNNAASIKTWLDGMRGRLRLAIEPTHLKGAKTPSAHYYAAIR